MTAIQNLFLTAPMLLTQAIEQEKQGLLGDWQDTVGAALGYVGDNATLFMEHFKAAKVAGAEKTAKAAADKRIKGFTAPASVAGILAEILADFEHAGADKPKAVSLTFTLTHDSEGKPSVTQAWGTSKPRAARTGNGSVGSKSNISAWNAYQRGVKAGDPENITKGDNGVYNTPDGPVGKGERISLVQYFRDNPVVYSNTADVLRQYGKMD